MRGLNVLVYDCEVGIGSLNFHTRSGRLHILHESRSTVSMRRYMHF
jgi:hypothetical protein